MYATGQVRDVERLCVVAVDAVTHPTQSRQVFEARTPGPLLAHAHAWIVARSVVRMQAHDVLPHVPADAGDALALFDGLAAVEPAALRGTWRGAEVPTGHPMDGLLALTGWWGKRFVDAERVDPLLFPSRDGRSLWPMSPVLAFGAAEISDRLRPLRALASPGRVSIARPGLRARGPRARLRTTRYRGVDSATMIYDRLPINDVFRRIDEDAVLGAMDMRGAQQPYFFVLRRDSSLPVS